MKRVNELERVISRLKTEKQAMESKIESQKIEFDYKLAQTHQVMGQERRTREELVDL